ncbi:MAG TPA: DUF222 domain-containing protein [Ilumatobacter sp.]|nr:DUF222 domain-containing protein [Ilumatobacter sp.]
MADVVWATKTSETCDDDAVEAANERLGVIAGHLNAVNAELVDATVELLSSGAWQQGGKQTPSAFLQWRLGLSKARADDVVAVARRRADFPTLMGGFGRGELSLEQVAAAIEAPAWADALVYDFVKISTVGKIRRAMRSNMFEPDPDEPAPEPDAVHDRLSFGPTANGRWRINAELGIDDGRRIESALNERRDAMFTAGDEDVTWPEAFVECMERSLDVVESTARRDRFRTWLHLDVTDGEATTTDGWRIPMATRDRILCDGVVQPVWASDGVPFSVGRAQHIVPHRTRRIVERRDRGCRVPGCTADRFVEVHHIVHWQDGGATDTSNLVCVCPRHHKMHHQGQLGISGTADEFDGLVFTDERDRPIAGSGTPVLPTRPPPSPRVAYAPPLAGRFDWNWIGLGWVHPNARRKRIDEARRLSTRYRDAA